MIRRRGVWLLEGACAPPQISSGWPLTAAVTVLTDRPTGRIVKGLTRAQGGSGRNAAAEQVQAPTIVQLQAPAVLPSTKAPGTH